MLYFKLKWVFMKIFHCIKRFFCPVSVLPGSVYKQIRPLTQLLLWGGLLLGGCLAAAAFPPLNWHLAAFAAIAVLLLTARNLSAWKAALAGWVWGMGYALCAFFWLREINAVIPWLLMFVLGAYYIPLGWMAAIANRYILLPREVREDGFTRQSQYRDFPLLRQFCWCLVCASTLVVVEYLRHSVLPWNYFGTAFYRNSVMMQLVRWTGIWGLSFLAAFFNAALALALLTMAHKDPASKRICYRRPWPLLTALLLLAVVMAVGISSLRSRRAEYASYRHKTQMTLVQGKLSQRRSGGEQSAFEALSTYVKLTRSQQGVPTDLVVWPETAVNYPLRGSAAVCSLYRHEVRELSRDMAAPILLGTLEYDFTVNPPGTLNSAVLTDSRDVVREGYMDIYSKVHPVPFGEYVPMRRYLPAWVVNIIDMQRDLTPGRSLEPIKLNEQVNLGVNICFEDVFPYISRAEYMRNANVLLVITNDAWYPASSEPEQHLANSVARAIETNLPMVRCGNDSATCLITPGGEIIWSLAGVLEFGDGKPHRRGAGAATITVNVPDVSERETTFYSRYGDWLAWLSMVTVLTALVYIGQERLKFLRRMA